MYSFGNPIHRDLGKKSVLRHRNTSFEKALAAFVSYVNLNIKTFILLLKMYTILIIRQEPQSFRLERRNHYA